MTLPLWSSAEIAKATGGTATGMWVTTGVSIDSRTLQPGDLFIAIRGDTHDGHDHVAQALAKGAGGLLLSHDVGTIATNAPVVMVPDTQAALAALAMAARDRANGTLIAITGSVGKTTTKEMLHQVALAQGTAHATLGNLNNHLGLPLTLCRLPKQARIGVFEIGMNHPDEIAPLSRLLRPHHALITNVGTAHLQNFSEGPIGIARAKAEIFAGLQADGSAIIPADSEFSGFLADEARRYGQPRLLGFGHAGNADACLLTCTLGEECSEVTARIGTRTLSYHLPLPGEHMALNSVAVLLAAQQMGLDLDQAAVSLSAFTPLKGRGVRKIFGGITVIDESYNASPLSMTAAIRVLAQSRTHGRRLVALGDMLELGDGAAQAHAALAAVLDEAQVDQVFCCGPQMQHLWQVLPPARRGSWAPDARTLAPLVAGAAREGDVLLVKGSRGQQVEIHGVMSPSMAQVIAAVETAHPPTPAREDSPHAP